MKEGDLTTGPAKLRKAWEKLCVHWESVKHHWHDEVSREFEENYLLTLEPHLAATQQRMQSVAATFGAARQECDNYR